MQKMALLGLTFCQSGDVGEQKKKKKKKKNNQKQKKTNLENNNSYENRIHYYD